MRTGQNLVPWSRSQTARPPKATRRFIKELFAGRPILAFRWLGWDIVGIGHLVQPTSIVSVATLSRLRKYNSRNCTSVTYASGAPSCHPSRVESLPPSLPKGTCFASSLLQAGFRTARSASHPRQVGPIAATSPLGRTKNGSMEGMEVRIADARVSPRETEEDSPAFQRWVGVPPWPESRQGRHNPARRIRIDVTPS